MRLKLLALGLALASLQSYAQESGDRLNRSVFSGFHQLRAASRESVAGTRQKVRQHFPGMYVKTDPLTGNFTDIFGAAIQLPGNTPDTKAALCINQYLTDFGLVPGEWQLVRSSDAGHASFVHYKQQIDGRAVVFSRLSFRFTKDGKLQRIQMKNFGTPAAGIAPTLTTTAASGLVLADLADVVVESHQVDPNWVWFPVPGRQGYTVRPAYAFNVTGKGKTLPADIHGYIDAVSGEILYRQNKVKDIVDRTVKGEVYKNSPNQPTSIEPLAELAITINGTTYYTDSLGVFSDPNLVVPVGATVKLQGKWAKVNHVVTQTPWNVTVPAFQDTITASGGEFLFPATNPSSIRHVNAYYHVTRVHDFMKGHFPTFTGMDFALTTNVDRTDGSCNAFYTGANGSSINFYTATGGCNSFAICGDIVYHEYGHGINDKFYTWQIGDGMNNGALNEGEADIWALGITELPVLGEGSMTGGGGLIRRYDIDPKVYPEDLVGEVHADGEIIAGAWWDLGVNLNSVPMMTEIFAKTFFDTPDGPDGTEGDVYHQVLISALLNDDTDADISNGTPHFAEIIQAFAKHGIYLHADATLVHAEVPHQPANTPVTINADLIADLPAFVSGLKLYYRDRAAIVWDSVMMAPVAGNSYTATLPARTEGKIVDYYFAVYDTFNYRNVTFPEGYRHNVAFTQVTIPYQYAVAVGKSYGFDFETPLSGWTIANVTGDNATAGKWTQAEPIGSWVYPGSQQLASQPDFDHTFGDGGTGKCLVTANAASVNSQVNSADVDGGKTTVMTQVLDITGMTEPILEYYRWFSNNRGGAGGEDSWVVQAKDVNGTTWINLENTRKADQNWRRKLVAIRKLSVFANSSQIQVRFIATDAGSGGSVVEAAVDDLYIYDLQSALSAGNDPKTFKASIYPSPANEAVMVKLPGGTKGYIAMYDLTGKQLVRTELDGQELYRIPTGNIAAGTYFITVRTEHAVQSQKISILH